MLAPFIVSIVYGVVPIVAIAIGWAAIRKDYGPNSANSAPRTPTPHSDKEV